IWEAFGGNTCDLDSIWEEMGQDCSFTRSDLQRMRTVSASGFVATPSEPTSDDIKTFVKASKHNRLNETLEDSGKRRR
ncbi:hypothetical protein Tco_0463610, partial [Tanacetum coccineum]